VHGNGTSLVSDARGAGRLAVELTLLATEVVETMHHNIARRPGVLSRPTFERTRGVTGFVYRSVRGVTRLVGAGLDAALVPLVPLLTGANGWPGREPVVAALNGVLGDWLESTANPLATAMQLRTGGQPLDPTPAGIAETIPKPRSRVVVMVHGLCMSDLQWTRRAHDHGRALARDLEADVLYLRYNSGRHVFANGAAFAALLEQLVASWPVTLDELVLVGHSMGGLVIRSACAAAERHDRAWIGRLRALVFLGTPHHGAPMERGGQRVDLLLAGSPYTAAFTRLSRLRSAGITDMRHGTVLASDGKARDRFAHRADSRQPLPLPAGVPSFAIAGSRAKVAPRRGDKVPGDGLVPVASALGLHRDPGMTLGFAPTRRFVAYGTGHLDLLSSAEVYRRLRRWLRGQPSGFQPLSSKYSP
jgi:pimeloyl-ACP methyl ester carboxylesterase